MLHSPIHMIRDPDTFSLKVGGLHTIAADLTGFRPTHMIRLVDPALPESRLALDTPGAGELLVLRFRDVGTDDPDGPAVDKVEQILGFVDAALAAASCRPTRLYIHCHAGVSRSTATAYLALACRHGPRHEAAAFDALLRHTVKPWPNRRIVAHADALLGRDGRLLAPLDAYRQAHPHRLRAYGRLHGRRAARDAAYRLLMGM